MRILFTLLSITALTLALHAQGTGTWRSYLSYHDITEACRGGNIIYVLASDNLYSYNTDDSSVQTYDKVATLSDCQISHIAWCQDARRLIIIYTNSNIDLLEEDGNVINIPSYYNKSMMEDKTVNSITMDGNYAYLATNFGIMKVNVADAEISDTYNLGFAVSYCYLQDGKLYAASPSAGLYSGNLSDNLLDRNQWTRVGNFTPRQTGVDNQLLEQLQQADPGGPADNHFGFMRVVNDKLYGVSKQFGIHGYVHVFDGTNWSEFDDSFASSLGHRYVGHYNIDVDPKDDTHAFVCGQTGLYEFRDGKLVTAFSNDNSPLQTAITVGNNNKDYVVVTSVKFDSDGRLWVANSISPSTSLLEYSSGEWTDHQHDELMIEVRGAMRSLEAMEQMMFDSRGLMWMANNLYRTPSLIRYDPQSDAVKVYDTFVNQDGTSIVPYYVHCVAEDNIGNIWIGTDMGPLYLPSLAAAGGQSETFAQVKVPRNDGTIYADYLLDGVDISCMAIDGAGRKWFGTNGNGVYLISASNLEQLQHFTAANSKLFSDNIEGIAINSKTGEVFFGTDKGLCSYMSGATQTNDDLNKDDVYAYPNPVGPDYTGVITVTGLTLDADVKIVTSNGVLVAEGKSTGGSFSWDGLDKKGKRVASGVYFVEVATSEGKKGTVCRIAVVN